MDTIVTVVQRNLRSSWLNFKRKLKSLIGLSHGYGVELPGDCRSISWTWIKWSNGCRYYGNDRHHCFVEAHGELNRRMGKTTYNPKHWGSDFSGPVYALRIGRLYWRLNMEHEYNQRTNMYGGRNAAAHKLVKLVPFMDLYYRRRQELGNTGVLALVDALLWGMVYIWVWIVAHLGILGLVVWAIKLTIKEMI